MYRYGACPELLEAGRDELHRLRPFAVGAAR
jgi:hypothetical protein